MAMHVPDGGSESADDDVAIFADINITPLTDVFLVLVLIFMLSSVAAIGMVKKSEQAQANDKAQSEAAQRSGLQINLPAGAARELDPASQSIVLSVPVSGDIAVGGTPVSDAALDAALRAEFVRNPAAQVILQADRGVAHGRVVSVMEKVRRVGLTRLAIGTSPQ